MIGLICHVMTVLCSRMWSLPFRKTLYPETFSHKWCQSQWISCEPIWSRYFTMFYNTIKLYVFIIFISNHSLVVFGQWDCIKPVAVFCQSPRARLLQSGFINSGAFWRTQSAPRHRSQLRLWWTLDHPSRNAPQEHYLQHLVLRRTMAHHPGPQFVTSFVTSIRPRAERTGGLECREQGWWKWAEQNQRIPSASLLFSVRERPLRPVWSGKEKWKHVARSKPRTVCDHLCYVNEQQLLAG